MHDIISKVQPGVTVRAEKGTAMLEETGKKAAELLDACIEKAKAILNDREEVKAVLTRAQTKIDNSPVLIEKGGNTLANMIGLIKKYADGTYTQASEDGILNVLGAFVYLTEAFDAVPDVIPVVGYSDDLEVLFCAAERASKDLKAYDQWSSK